MRTPEGTGVSLRSRMRNVVAKASACARRRRHLLHLTLVLVLAATSQAGDAAKPNILFLFSDDQRADSIAALGNGRVRTPNLDRLVNRGTTFTRAYCMGAMQGAVCVPSRAMLMTGRSLFRIHEQLKEQETWPERFAAAGWRTFITGKWHNGAASVTRVFDDGRAVFLGGMTDPLTAPVQDFSTHGALSAKQPSGKHVVERFADEAVTFLAAQNGSQPFLCYVAFNAPHDPRVAPTAYHTAYRADPPVVPRNFMPQHPFDNGELMVRDEKLLPTPRDETAVRREIGDYYAAITFMDEQIGRILAALESSGQAGNTIIVFSSDHGLALGSHGLLGKQNLYEHSMRAPLIIAGPGLPAGKRSAALCHLLDIFPTLGDLAGVPAPTGSEGQSLGPVLRGQSDTARPLIGTAYRKVQRAVTDGRWKLIAYPQVPRVQLFDLQSDPDERQDLAGDPANAVRLAGLVTALQGWQRAHGDPLPPITLPPVP
ncbi:MAG: sulfatase-like hydrolase/transferase [Planctomycetes bacterium]|nr:sulfatase-like hydrolase/transferase [Planctomycetota bacterium]